MYFFLNIYKICIFHFGAIITEINIYEYFLQGYSIVQWKNFFQYFFSLVFFWDMDKWKKVSTAEIKILDYKIPGTFFFHSLSIPSKKFY